MTYEELYIKGTKYKITVEWEKKTFFFTVLNVRYSKTGRVSAQIQEGDNAPFWTSASKPSTPIIYIEIKRKNFVSSEHMTIIN